MQGRKSSTGKGVWGGHSCPRKAGTTPQQLEP